jgi:hypothetical protein
MKESTKNEALSNPTGTGEQMQKSNIRPYYTDIPSFEEFTKMVKDIIKEKNEKLNNARQQLANSQS